MADSADSLSSVYSFVERAYLRLQASDVLTQCLENGDTAPLQILVEDLVCAGPQSVRAIREILIEVKTRKIQLKDDLFQLKTTLETSLDTGNLLGRTHEHLVFLEEVEKYIRDWLWGVMYQSIHQELIIEMDPRPNPLWVI
jgi:hypothetical protein